MKWYDEVTMEEWIEELSQKELAALFVYVGTSLLGYSVIGAVMALVEHLLQ